MKSGSDTSRIGTVGSVWLSARGPRVMRLSSAAEWRNTAGRSLWSGVFIESAAPWK